MFELAGDLWRRGRGGIARTAPQPPPSVAPRKGCENKQNIPRIQLYIPGESPVAVRCGLQDFQTDPVGATGTGGVWSGKKKDSTGSVGLKKKKKAHTKKGQWEGGEFLCVIREDQD